MHVQGKQAAAVAAGRAAHCAQACPSKLDTLHVVQSALTAASAASEGGVNNLHPVHLPGIPPMDAKLQGRARGPGLVSGWVDGWARWSSHLAARNGRTWGPVQSWGTGCMQPPGGAAYSWNQGMHDAASMCSVHCMAMNEV